MALGKKTGGRIQGTPNKLTQDVKQAIEYVAEGLGGAEGMLKWAREESENTRVFWSQMYPKLLPREIKAEHSGEMGAASPVLVVPAALTPEAWSEAVAAYRVSTDSSAASSVKMSSRAVLNDEPATVS